MKKRIISVVMITLIFSTTFIQAYEQKSSTMNSVESIIETTTNKDELSKSEAKLSTDLLKLVRANYTKDDNKTNVINNDTGKTKSLVSTGVVSQQSLKKSSDDLSYVYIKLKPGTDTAIISPLVNTIVNCNKEKGLVAAWVEVDKLASIAALGDVKSIYPVLPPTTNSGSINSQGDSLHKADLFRNLTDIDGTGLKVGVISDGVDHWEAAKESGDLPSINVISNTQGGDEGTSMLEVVHDIAPGASLYFHDHGSNVMQFTQAIKNLVDSGCKIILDDVNWPTEPFFEDGFVASYVNSIISGKNIIYISSAGNYGNNHYQGVYKDYLTLVHKDEYHFHDFDSSIAGLQSMPIRVEAGESTSIVLQWDDKFGSSSNDYDLFLRNNSDIILGTSEVTQTGSNDPVEVLKWTNNSNTSQVVYVDVRKWKGDAKNIEMYVQGGTVEKYNVKADSIFGHAAIPDVITVGAVNASKPNEIVASSSQGPVTINNPQKQVRNKPDVCGIDGVSVTGAGGVPNTFSGTSAAASHVAGIAVLVWSQYPAKSAAEIRTMINKGTVDLGKSGFDYLFGNGRVDTILAGGPGSPKGITVLPGDKKATLSWHANVDPDLNGYQLEYRLNTSASWTVLPLPKAATTYTVTNLVNNSTYNFRIKAIDIAKNYSLYSDTVTAKAIDNVPAAVPSGLKIISLNDKLVALSWTAVSTVDLAGYQLEYKKQSESDWIPVQLGKVSSYTVSGLTNDTTYNFRIKSKDLANNLSEASLEVSGDPTDKTAPAVPLGLKVDSIGNDCSIKLSWNVNSEIDLGGYEIAYQKNGTTQWVSNNIPFNLTSTTINGLAPNVKYTFKVRAKDLKENWSAYSSVLTATPLDKIAPSAPSGFEAVPSDKKTLLKWNRNVELDVMQYQLEYKLSNASTWTTVSVSSSIETYTVSNLTNGQEYVFRVKAKDYAGNFSNYSTTASAKPVDNVAPPIPLGLKVTSENDKQVTLSWTPVTATDLAGYILMYKSQETNIWNQIDIGKVGSYSFTGLVNDVQYAFSIKSKDLLNNISVASAEVVGTPVDKISPAVPTGLKIESIGIDSSIKLSWNKNVELDFDGYEIAYQKSGATEWLTQPVSADTATITLKELTANTKYLFKVRARDVKTNWSPYSSMVYATTIDKTPPECPSEFTVVTGDRKVILNWKSNEEVDLNGYQVEYKLKSSTTWKTLAALKSATSYSISSLVNGVEYEFRIKAKDTSGNWSEYAPTIIAIPHI